MAFGQSAGPPATGRQVQQLTALLHAAGHADFRDARGPLGLTQRQAAGKFTRDEADALITQLEGEADSEANGHAVASADHAAPPAARAAGAASPAADRRGAERERQLREMPAELLAAELQRRGWIVVEP